MTALTGNALAQSKTAIKQTNARPTTALGGDELFKEFCAVCHGADAAGPHGNRDMPVWGAIFKSISSNETFAQMRVEAVVKYLQSLQR